MNNNYYVENKTTGKIELHFDKETYVNLNQEQKNEIKSNFLFSRYTSAWVSRAKFPNLYRAEQIAQKLGLENAGTEGEKLTFEEQMQRKEERAERRADYYEYKSEKAAATGEQLQKPINDMHGDIAFFTQPNINTTSGRAFTNHRNKLWAAYEKGIDEFRKSEYYAQRAETARKATERPAKDFCQRRIDEADAHIRKIDRSMEEYEGYKKQIEAGETPHNKYGWEIKINLDEIEKNLDRWEELKGDYISKIAYYDALIQEQGGILYNKDNIKIGYIVKLNKAWRGMVKVTRTGTKNFRARDIDGTGFDLEYNYSEIAEVIKAETEEKKNHPFETGEKYAVQVWEKGQYVEKIFEIVKVTNDKVTIKAGTDRAKAITPRKSYDGKTYYVYCGDGLHAYFTKAATN